MWLSLFSACENSNEGGLRTTMGDGDGGSGGEWVVMAAAPNSGRQARSAPSRCCHSQCALLPVFAMPLFRLLPLARSLVLLSQGGRPPAESPIRGCRSVRSRSSERACAAADSGGREEEMKGWGRVRPLVRIVTSADPLPLCTPLSTAHASFSTREHSS